MRKDFLNRHTSEHLSQWLLYTLIGLSVIIFGGFYLIGFDAPFASNPEFNAPLLTDVVLWLMAILLVATLVASVVSVISGIRKGNTADRVINGIPAWKIRWAVGGGVGLLLLVTALTGQTATMRINGQPYADTFWLRFADMFVNTALILLAIAIVAVGYGYTRYYRRKRK